MEIPRQSVEQVDEVLLERGAASWSVLEDVIAGRAWIVGMSPSAAVAAEEWRGVAGALEAAGVRVAAEPVHRELGDADWKDSYKSHFKAWQFDRLHWVPVWERDSFVLPPGDAVLWLDPGLAFGTGNHETTRLCVERLVTLAEETGVSPNRTGEVGNTAVATSAAKPPVLRRVVDAGCGSGILALSAALLGYRDVRGFDNDPDAIRISEENASLNGLSGRVRFEVADLSHGLADESGKVDVLLANIQADVLMRHAKELVAAVAQGGTLVLSGILSGENSQVRSVFEEHARNWSVNARVMGEWSDIVLTRPV